MWYHHVASLKKTCFAQILFVRPCVVMTHNNLCGLITVPTLASGSLYPPFVLCSIIYALPAGLHPAIWQANVHKAARDDGTDVMLWSQSQSQQNIQCVCECVIGITTRLLCYSPTHLTFIHHPSFLPSLPDSPLIEIYYPHPATGPQCQDDHTLCSRNGHTNHSLMQTVLIYSLGDVSFGLILFSSGWICCS